MFANRYFAPRYFAPRYFPAVGAVVVVGESPLLIIPGTISLSGPALRGAELSTPTLRGAALSSPSLRDVRIIRP